MKLKEWLEINYSYLIEITNNIYNDTELKEFKLDILNDCILSLYNMDKKKCNNKINQGKMTGYVIRMLYFNKISKPGYLQPCSGSAPSKIYKSKKLVNLEKIYYLEYDDSEYDIDNKINFENKLDKILNILYNKEICKNNGSVKLFEMYYLERFTYKEIMELTNMSYFRINDNIKFISNLIKKELNKK